MKSMFKSESSDFLGTVSSDIMWITNHVVLHRLLQIMIHSLGCIHSTSLNTNLHSYSVHYWLGKFVFSDVPKQFVKPYLFKHAIRISRGNCGRLNFSVRNESNK